MTCQDDGIFVWDFVVITLLLSYYVGVEGDIENVNGVLKITIIRVKYHLKVTEEKMADAKECHSNYITRCPAAQSVIGCIKIEDELLFEK